MRSTSRVGLEMLVFSKMENAPMNGGTSTEFSKSHVVNHIHALFTPICATLL
jgi:hypothetical protein